MSCDFSALRELLNTWSSSRSPRNSWLMVHSDSEPRVSIRLYLRRAMRRPPGRVALGWYFDIAQIECYPTGEGLFSELVGWLKQELPTQGYCGIYVECVQSTRLKRHLLSSGWVESTDDPNCFFWEFSDAKDFV